MQRSAFDIYQKKKITEHKYKKKIFPFNLIMWL